MNKFFLLNQLKVLISLFPYKNILIIGSGKGECLDVLDTLDIENAILVEADKDQIEEMYKLHEFPSIFTVENALIYKDEENITFNIATNPEVSCFKDIESYKEIMPNIALIETKKMKAISLDSFLQKNKKKQINWLFIDTLSSLEILKESEKAFSLLEVIVCKLITETFDEFQALMKKNDFKLLEKNEENNPDILTGIFVKDYKKKVVKTQKKLQEKFHFQYIKDLQFNNKRKMRIISNYNEVENRMNIENLKKQSRKKIIVIGFSVSEQNTGYVDKLKEYYGNNNVDSYSIGGGHMSLILYLLSQIKFENYTDCLLELSTSVRWHKNDYNRYFNIINYIINYIKQFKINLKILQLYRSDVDCIKDALLNAIEDSALLNNIVYTNILEFDKNPSHYLRDGIHPTKDGVDYYANEAIKLLDMEGNSVSQKNSSFERIHSKYKPRLITVNSNEINKIEGEYTISSFSRRDIHFNTLVVQENNSIIVKFFKKIYIMGILCKIGRETSKVEVFKNTDLVREFHLYDNKNYYSRYAPIWFRLPDTDEIRINSIRVEELPELAKGSPYMEEQSISIVGILCSDTMLPF